ncbi:MAG: hypothetical protein AAEA78_04270 [Methylophilaceae bacterium]
MTIFPWQLDTWVSLLSNKTRLAHAYIFHGNKGAGINRFTEAFVFSLICSTPNQKKFACGKCQDCIWSTTEHPDLKIIRPSEINNKTDSINVDSIREIKKLLELTSHKIDGKKIVVIYDAERLTMAASNALLKIIEEPPENTFFVLSTNNLSYIIPTIISRCLLLSLRKPNKEEALAYLSHTNNNNLLNHLSFYNHSPLEVIEEKEMQPTISLIIAELKKGKEINLIDININWLSNGLSWTISFLQKWVYEIIVFKLTTKNNFFPHNTEDIKKLASMADLSKLLSYNKSLNQVKSISTKPINKDITLDSLIIEYKKIFN